LNAYLIPAWFVKAEDALCAEDQRGRATGIGRLIADGDESGRARVLDPAQLPTRRDPPAPYDIAALQEIWGAGMAHLEAPLAAATQRGTGAPLLDVLRRCRSWWGLTAVDTLLQVAQRRGGLWLAARADALCAEASVWHTFGMSDTRSGKGAVAVRYAVRTAAGQPTGRSLIVVNTHLDPVNDNRMIDRQLAELGAWLHDRVAADAAFCPAPAATSLLVVGDFNETAAFVLPRLKAVNVAAADLYAASGAPEAPTYDGRRNRLVVWKGERRRIDLQLGVARVGGVEFRAIAARDAEVLTQPAGSELSDHYPVRVTVDV
jgi:endonuclease/exonuclease/phosphatase family metal-dependent hydrolase